jgi:hypothetical protein
VQFLTKKSYQMGFRYPKSEEIESSAVLKRSEIGWVFQAAGN